MAFDEMFYIHERLSDVPKDWLLGGSTLSGKVILWQILFAPFVGVGLALLVFQTLRFKAMNLTRPLLFLLAGISFWVMAFFFEGVVRTVFLPKGMYYTEVMLEEFSEMAGATCILSSFLYYLERMRGTLPEAEPITMRTFKAATIMGGGIFTVMLIVIALVILLASNIPAGHFKTSESISYQIAEYEEILEKDPDTKEIYIPLIDACQYSNHYEKIVKWANVYMGKFPDKDGEIRFRLASSHLYLGNKDKAREVANELIKEFPSNENYTNLIDRIKKVKSDN